MPGARTFAMTAKLIPAAFVVALSCSLGCSSTTTTSTPATPATPKKAVVAKSKPRELRSAEVAQTMQPLTNELHIVANMTKEGGVGLTGPERSYIERTDNSGWSGRSAPAEGAAIGGGPTPESTPEPVSSDATE